MFRYIQIITNSQSSIIVIFLTIAHYMRELKELQIYKRNKKYKISLILLINLIRRIWHDFSLR